MEKYQILGRIGDGTYGLVHKGRNLKTNEIVAMKQIEMENLNEGIPGTAIREISLLKEMKHENIVRLLDIEHTGQSFYIVMEYMDMDLVKYMESCPEFSRDHPQQVKRFLYQILCGVAYCHSHRILHRDLNPKNMLIDHSTNTLKLAGFRLSRSFIPGSVTQQVETRYRAPEILLGSTQYSTPVDIWSVGCIFAEMVNKKPLFEEGSEKGSEISTLKKISGVVGAPNEARWPGYNTMFVHKPKPKIKDCDPEDMAKVVPNLDAAGQDLLSKMLCLDPKQRISAKSALEHAYFKDIKLTP